MMQKNSIFVLACVGCAHALWAAEAVTLTTNDVPGETSFSLGVKWSDGLPPHADADYVVDGYTLRSPSSTAVFAGHSLTLTNSGLLTMLSTSRITVSNLQMCVNGRIHNGTSGSTVMLDGTANVQTPVGEFFYFTGRNNEALVYSALSGDGALAFQIAVGGAGTLDYTLLGANSGFTGKLRVMGVAGKETKLTLDNPSAVQSPMGSFTADGILLLTNAALVVNADTTLSEASNRGITLKKGGMLGAAAEATFRVAVPVVGDNLTKTLPGTLELAALNTFTNLVVSNGTVRLSRSENLTGATVVDGSLEAGAALPDIALAGGLLAPGLTNNVMDVAVSHLKLAGGGLRYDLTGLTQDIVRIVQTLEKNAGVVTPIVLNGVAVTNTVAVRPLLVAEALDTFSESDFSLSYAQPGLHLPEGSLEIVRDAGTPSLAFRQARPIVVQIKAVVSGNNGFAKPEYWSNAQIPSADNDYVLNMSANMYGESDFPGHSLSIANDGAVLQLKNTAMMFSDLRLYQGRIHNAIANSTINLDGSIGVYAPESAPFSITGNNNTINCFARLKGSGALKITMQSGASNFRFNFMADNSEFTGQLVATNYPGGGNTVRIGVGHDGALGGPLPVYRPNAVNLGSGTYVYALSNVTLRAANRGITHIGTCYYSVPTNRTLSIESLITGSVMRKQDDGLLVLSGTNTFSGFVAEGGSVEARHEQALGIKTVQFNAGTVLRLQAGRNKLENGVRLTQATPLNATASVSVMPVFEADETIPVSFELPVFLLNSGSELNAPLTFVGLPKYRTQVNTRAVDVDGTARTLVYATFTYGGTVMQLQ